MADRMFAPELKALAYKEVRATLCKESRPSLPFIVDLYAQTVPGDQLRSYILELCTYHALYSSHDSDWKETIEATQDFATEFATRPCERISSSQKSEKYPHPFSDKAYESLVNNGLKENKPKANERTKHKAKDMAKVSSKHKSKHGTHGSNRNSMASSRSLLELAALLGAHAPPPTSSGGPSQSQQTPTTQATRNPAGLDAV